MSTETATPAQPQKPETGEASEPKESPLQSTAMRIGLLVMLVLGLAWGLHAFVRSFYYESTDDAFIEAHVVTISTKLSNIVQEVKIDDNYEVKKGDLLVGIDPRDYLVQLHVAEANEKKARSDYDRDVALSNTKAISTQDLDTTRAATDIAEAQLEQARLNLEYTRITAPVAGRITRKNVEPGIYVEAGTTLLSIVPDDMWVIANFKETQLTRMRPGQPVTIRVDAFPGRVFKGHVDSLQSGTGARFSLLPAENATGNYVKVVQRLPVKIVFDEPPEVRALFSPGLSVVPEVKVR